MGVRGWNGEGRGHLHGLSPVLRRPQGLTCQTGLPARSRRPGCPPCIQTGPSPSVCWIRTPSPTTQDGGSVSRAWAGPDQHSRQCGACAPTHACSLSQHPHLTFLSLARCFPGTMSPFSPAQASLGLPVAFGCSTHSCIMTASLQLLWPLT